MAGRALTLTDPNLKNNAFVMRIGPLLVIEFGVTGNACYVFAAADFRTSLETSTLSIAELKQRASATRLSHIASWEGRFDMELRRLLRSVPSSKGQLDPKLPKPQTQSQPTSFAGSDAWRQQLNAGYSKAPVPDVAAGAHRGRFTQSEFDNVRALCVQHGIEWEDNRPRKGALWVLIPDRKRRVGFSVVLESYGFRYTEGRGFWIKDGA